MVVVGRESAGAIVAVFFWRVFLRRCGAPLLFLRGLVCTSLCLFVAGLVAALVPYAGPVFGGRVRCNGTSLEAVCVGRLGSTLGSLGGAPLIVATLCDRPELSCALSMKVTSALMTILLLFGT